MKLVDDDGADRAMRTRGRLKRADAYAPNQETGHVNGFLGETAQLIILSPVRHPAK